MKEKSIFSQIVFLILLGVICFSVTIFLTFLAGSYGTRIFQLENLNWANAIPVLLLGIFVNCVIVGIGVLYLARNGFLKAKDYVKKTKDGGVSK